MKKKNTWKVKPMVEDSFVPSAHRTSVSYSRLTDFKSVATPSPPKKKDIYSIANPLTRSLFVLSFHDASIRIIFLHHRVSTYIFVLVILAGGRIVKQDWCKNKQSR